MTSQRVHKRMTLCIMWLQYLLGLLGFVLRHTRFAG